MKILDNEIEEGYIYGFITDTRSEEQLDSYLEKQGRYEAVNKIQTSYRKIAILTNMYIEEEERGNGHGSFLLENFIDDASLEEVEAIILVADTGEKNQFDLVRWYNDYDFEVIFSERNVYPVMVKILEF